tara:strand:+ start:451 stop:609 length:159 start_codon:yes stop_codon:yes gene_type:complete
MSGLGMTIAEARKLYEEILRDGFDKEDLIRLYLDSLDPIQILVEMVRANLDT